MRCHPIGDLGRGPSREEVDLGDGRQPPDALPGGQCDTDNGPGAGGSGDRQRATECGHPLADRGQADVAVEQRLAHTPVGDPTAVVRDLEDHAIATALKAQLDLARVGVLGGVAEELAPERE